MCAGGLNNDSGEFSVWRRSCGDFFWRSLNICRIPEAAGHFLRENSVEKMVIR